MSTIILWFAIYCIAIAAGLLRALYLLDVADEYRRKP
jgi:hypothetical protein